MSVQTNQYAGFGYWLDYKQAEAALEAKYDTDQIEDIFDKYHDSAFDKKIVEINGFSMITDGMDGNYFFFGKIDAKSEVYEPLNVTIAKIPSTKVKKSLKEEIVNVFGTDFNMKPVSLVFTHYR